MAHPTQFKMVIPSRLTELPTVQRRVIEAAKAHGFAREPLFAIRLALEEALSNAIRHGNQDNPNLKVTIDCTVDDQKATIEICDQGSGFSPDQLPDPTARENLTEPHGRGVMLIQAYMTEVHFNKAGNCLTLIKHRDCRKPNPR